MSGVGTTIEVSAAVSAIVTAIVGSLLNWGARLVAWSRRVLPPDHSAINTGSLSPITSVAEGRERIGVLVAVAPSRGLRRTEFDPDRAIALVHRFFGHLVGVAPEFSTPSAGVRFVVNEQLDDGSTMMTRRVTVNPSGRVDLLLYLPVQPNTGDPNTYDLPLAELAGPLLTVLGCCLSDAYRATMGDRRRRRFDWHFGLSNALRDGARVQRYWRVKFPGRSADKSGDQHPASPAEGFAARELRGWRVSKGWEALVETALAGFLKQIGYYNCEAAIADTLIEVRQRVLHELGNAEAELVRSSGASRAQPPIGADTAG